jgi:TolB-like protein
MSSVRRLIGIPAMHSGLIVKTTGDGVLIEFASVVGAVKCALALQTLTAERNADIPSERRMEWRTGVHLGDVLVDGDDILGHGVNIAARLEGIAPPGGICISEDAYRQVRGKVEAEFTYIGEQSLKNIARPLRVYRCSVASEPEPSAGYPTPLPLPDKPSIALLPFANMNGEPEQEYFLDGMVEEIITALSRVRWLFVIARNSSFSYKGQSPDVKQVGRELGVRYVLEGSVRKGDSRVRITAQLIDAETGTHLGADRFDGLIEDVFELQDKVAISVAGVIEPALQVAETARAANRPTTDLSGYDLYLRGYVTFFSGGKQIPDALRLFEQAIERDPRYGPALAWAPVCCMRLCLDGRSTDPEGDRRKGSDFARRSLQVAGDDQGTLANAALALAYFGEDIGTMMALVDRALALNPSFARGWYIGGILRKWAGEPDLAIEHAEASLRLSPRGRFGTVFYLIAKRISSAGASTRRYRSCSSRSRTTRTLRRPIAVSPPAMPRWDGSMRRGRSSRGCAPSRRSWVDDAMVFRNPEHRDLFLSGLRLAAGEAQ